MSITTTPPVVEAAVAATATVAPRRSALSRLLDVFGLVGFLLILIVVFSIISERFFSPSNFGVILSNAAVIGIVSVGQTFVIISGGFDLSVAGLIPLSSVVFAMSVNGGVPMPAALAMVLIGGALFGALNGFLVTIVRISPLIATLGTSSVAGGLAFVVSSGLSQPFKNLDDGILAAPGLFGLPNQVLIFVVVVLLAFVLLRFTLYGRSVYAIGGSREASRLAGMRVEGTVTSVYALSGLLAGLAGVVVASQLLSGSGTLGSQSALSSIAAVVLGGAALTGGIGGIWGTVLGVFILGVLSNGLALLQVSSFYQTIATGVVLLVAVAFGTLRTRFSSR